ncbi:MAG: S-layer homology domain-containing protein [Oscillospiraceae bacterium]|nr:S-layer homology domain-containing protein [Oscillospiraceae bacterium]
MNGTSATAFSPQSSLNRAMVATVLSRIGDNPSISFRPIFHDVSPGQWYSGPITWAHDRGVVTGMPDGSFVPGRNIPTEQLAVMIHRYAESRGLNLAVPNHVTAPAGTSDWAAEAMGWAIHNGFLRSHNPHAPATRAETAYFVYRFSVHYGL